MRIRRRDLWGLAGAASAIGASASAAPPVRFLHGVASGDPGASDIVLWTRVTPLQDAAGPVTLRWIVWREGQDAAATGLVAAGPDRDFTAKVVVGGLTPATDYLFAFQVDDVVSPSGRFRTLAQDGTEPVVLVVASCQSYPVGLFNAWDAVARMDRIDAVVHLGDYIYEHGPGPDALGREETALPGRAPDPPRELVTLDDYRRRHAQYKTDPDLQAAHARAPFICVLDDHEIANDAWTGGAQNHTPETEGDFAVRKAAALRAWFEWMPIREPDGGLSPAALNRVFHFGDLASLAMLETRLTARDRQLDYARDLTGAADASDVAAFEARRQDPTRRLIGEAQRRWLSETLGRSRASGKPWQLIGNQILMARVRGPDLGHFDQPWLVNLAMNLFSRPVRQRIARMISIFRLGLPWSLDTWDGYPAERERLYADLAQANVTPIVLTGDSHAWWVNRLADQAGQRRAIEFGVASITSLSAGDAAPQLPLGEALARANEEVLFCRQTGKGFLRLTLTRDAATADLMIVSTIRAKPYRLTTLRSFRIPRAEDGPGEVGTI